MIQLFNRLFLLVLFALLALPLILAIAAIETNPLVVATGQLSHQDIARIRQLLRQHDPRRVQQAIQRTLSLTERDLDLLLKYAAPRHPETHTRVDLHPDGMQARLTVTLPDNPLGRYLNVTAELSSTGETLQLEQLTFGRLALPGWLLEPLLRLGHRLMLARHDQYREAVEAISSHTFGEDRLVIVYRLNPALVERLQQHGRGLLFPAEEARRMRAYYRELTQFSRQQSSHHLSLARVLPPLFRLAAERSAGGTQAPAENRALLLTLAMHVLGVDLARYIELPPGTSRPQLHFTLQGRHDLAQHYLVSAALALSAGSGLAGALGVFKELDDSRGGSGFSFADLLADRAGIRLAEMATDTGTLAATLQQRLSSPLQESDFMPGIDDLPEGIMELEFRHRYRDPDSENYRRVEDEIERRLARCPVYAPA